MRGLFDLAVLKTLERHGSLDELFLDDLAQRNQTIFADGAQRDHEFVLLNRRVGVLEVEPVGDFALSLIDGVSDFLVVHFGDNVKSWHAHRVAIAARRCVQPERPLRFGRTNNTVGSVPKRPKGADCKSAGTAFEGSNPSRPTI